MKPTALESIMPFDTAKYQRNRLGLAHWTTDTHNPLTARVFVNFIWQELFGKIVNTSADYGLRGELPTHPKLLDWLAVDFMEHQWNIKYLIKKIVMSSTFKQSAEMNSEQLKLDPENVYFGRTPTLCGEIIRDFILSSSGLQIHKLVVPVSNPTNPKECGKILLPDEVWLLTHKIMVTIFIEEVCIHL